MKKRKGRERRRAKGRRREGYILVVSCMPLADERGEERGGGCCRGRRIGTCMIAGQGGWVMN